MMNYVWGAMIVFSFVSAIVTGNMQDLSNSIMEGALEAVNLCVKLLSIICLWSGLMEIAEKSGVTKGLSTLLWPILKVIFPKLQKGSETANAVSMNMTANLLGLGSAATPFGIEAMRRMHKGAGCPEHATNDMIKFVVLNTASLHIIPTTIAMLRQEHGSTVPMDILPASIVASVASLTVGILACVILSKVRRYT